MQISALLQISFHDLAISVALRVRGRTPPSMSDDRNLIRALRVVPVW